MEHVDAKPDAATGQEASDEAGDVRGHLPTFATAESGRRVMPAQAAAPPCATCGGPGGGAPSNGSYIYTLGQIEWRYPRISVEKEVAQATGRATTAGRTDQQAFHDVLSNRENRYLARQLCWVLSIQGLETYILVPRDAADLDLLISTLLPESRQWISAVIGVRGPVAPPELCNGLMVPIVVFDQIYTFSRDVLIEAIPRPEGIAAAHFEQAAHELFDRVLLLTDNAGATDQHRALNYLCMRYPQIYAKVAEQFAHDFSLTEVYTRPAALSTTRELVDAIFAFTNRQTDFTEKFFLRVDVTDEFPFLVTKLSPYYDR